MTQFQTTLSATIVLDGVGVHSGMRSSVTCSPAEADTGLVIDVRGTSGQNVRIRVRPEFLKGSDHCTSLGCDHAVVHTVEHLLAGLFWMGVDNVRIQVDGPEIPVCDGSALSVAREVKRVGLQTLEDIRDTYILEKPVCVQDSRSFVVGWPGEGFSVHCMIEFDHPRIGVQEFFYDGNTDHFLRDIAPARTFGFLKDWEFMKSRGLARGASLENTVVLSEDGVVGDGLRFETEFVRHKILDLLGDMAILGYRLQGRIFAWKPGHRINGMFVREIHGFRD